MLVIFDSLTGQTKKFAQKLGFECMHIKTYEGLPKDEIFLITRSFNFGEIPKTTKDFLSQYAKDVVGVAVSGNRNWGTNYGRAGDLIEKQYDIPLILKFEASGFNQDVLYVKEWIDNFVARKGE